MKEEKILKEKEQERFYQKLVQEVTKDFETRQKERLALERQWELNMNFLAGNQYVGVNSAGDLTEQNSNFYWQKKEVFNHIAPIIETRLAKFSRISPVISVRPKTDDDKDVAGATLAENLVSSVIERPDVISAVQSAVWWSETCGTGFYKVIWNNDAGELVATVDGKEVFEGDVEITAVSPFEIFPSSLYAENLADCESIIHAKAVKVKDVFEKYGVNLEGHSVDIYSLNKVKKSHGEKEEKGLLEDSVIVIEKYEKPTKAYPKGRLITVAGDKLLYYGELPYQNGKNKKYDYPFIKQISQKNSGSFFGVSIIERLIPVQRAFNAVKNRKHEFLNRLSMGVMMVEDGSIDVDDLAEEGLSPGKILVYRQGSKAPEVLTNMEMPADFADEEDKLTSEFVTISGVADVSSASNNAKLSSGTALEILVEQDNSRLMVTAEIIRNSYLEIARQVIRLYSQFMASIRALKIKTEQSKTQIIYLNKYSVNSDDVYLENENELLYTDSRKKEMIFKLFSSGILADKDGEIRTTTKEKILSLLGYKDLDYQKGISRLHEEKAQIENEKMLKAQVIPDDIDNHQIHIDEHTRYYLSEFEQLEQTKKQRIIEHINKHQQILNLQKTNQGEN